MWKRETREIGGGERRGKQGKRTRKVLVLLFGSRESGGTVINESTSRGNTESANNLQLTENSRACSVLTFSFGKDQEISS